MSTSKNKTHNLPKTPAQMSTWPSDSDNCRTNFKHTPPILAQASKPTHTYSRLWRSVSLGYNGKLESDHNQIWFERCELFTTIDLKSKPPMLRLCNPSCHGLSPFMVISQRFLASGYGLTESWRPSPIRSFKTSVESLSAARPRGVRIRCHQSS